MKTFKTFVAGFQLSVMIFAAYNFYLEQYYIACLLAVIAMVTMMVNFIPDTYHVETKQYKVYAVSRGDSGTEILDPWPIDEMELKDYEITDMRCLIEEFKKQHTHYYELIEVI